jgi:hypothetical protein
MVRADELGQRAAPVVEAQAELQEAAPIQERRAAGLRKKIKNKNVMGMWGARWELGFAGSSPNLEHQRAKRPVYKYWGPREQGAQGFAGTGCTTGTLRNFPDAASTRQQAACRKQTQPRFENMGSIQRRGSGFQPRGLGSPGFGSRCGTDTLPEVADNTQPWKLPVRT